MNVEELYDRFRADVQDEEQPFLWSDTLVFQYMDSAYKTFVRLTGGIADFTSDLCFVDIVSGEATAAVDKRILRFKHAYRVSDGSKIEVVNQTDLAFARDNDYGMIRPIYLDTTPGPVRYMVVGAQRGVVRWIQVPEANDQAQLYVDRLPLTKITEDVDPSFEFDEVGEEHVPFFSLWMQHLAYQKPDPDAYDPKRSESSKTEFEAYCAFAKAEIERYKTKVRTVAYGGL